MNVKKNLWAILVITFASAIYALGFVWCFAPNNIAFGGITGVAQIINHFIPACPVGMTVIVLNIPLFILGWRFIGGRLLVLSLYAMFISSVFIDILTPLYDWQPMEPLLACIFGGLLMGLSLGFVFQQGATTGGTDLAARLLKLVFKWLPMGKLLLAVDLIVVVSVALSFQTINTALYGLMALYISTLVMDMVIYGSQTAELAYIISDHSRKIAQDLLDLEMGITLLDGTGGFTGNEKKVILCAFKRHQIAVVKSHVIDIDPNAFIIVCQAHEVLGEGFGIYNKDSL